MAARRKTAAKRAVASDIPRPPLHADVYWRTAKVHWTHFYGKCVRAGTYDAEWHAFRLAGDAHKARAYGVDWTPLLSADADDVKRVHAAIQAARTAGVVPQWV